MNLDLFVFSGYKVCFKIEGFISFDSFIYNFGDLFVIIGVVKVEGFFYFKFKVFW